ncbi:ankyrin repeat protein [Aspergillus carlsbadensis]|nr:ankyrin repeat protein [Aspergillus carlsbadensis]
MDIRLPLREISTSYRKLPIPLQTPPETIELLRSLCIKDELNTFQETINLLLASAQPGGFAIEELGEVMFEAVKQDKAEFVSTLLSHGFSTIPCFPLEATLYRAKGALASYIEHGWDINEPLDEIRPPVLSYAVEDEELTLWLLDHGADPNRRCEIDCTPLSYAAQLAPINVINLMLTRGGDVSKGQLLQYAVFRATDPSQVLSLLVDQGAPLNGVMYQDGNPLVRFWPMGLGTALHIAAEFGKMEAIRHLLHLGADASIKDATGRTPLEVAQRFNQVPGVRLLESKL